MGRRTPPYYRCVGHTRDTYAAIRKDPAAAAAIRSWRTLTGGRGVRDPQRRTLIACSGGCDSSALALTLSAASRNLVIAHIVHDLRPPAQAHADRDAVQALAERLSVPFAQASIQPRAAGSNAEAAARRLRYQALARLASQHACPFVATAHHGDDLLETMLMRLLRGAGPRGLAAIRASRPLNARTTLIRPLLAAARADTVRLCGLAHHAWQEDSTNTDVSRFRSALRHGVVPALKALAPHVVTRAVASSDLLAGAADLVHDRATALLAAATRDESGLWWLRASLAAEPPVVLGELLRLAARDCSGGRGMDRLSRPTLRRATEAIRDDSTEPRTFAWRSVRLLVTARRITVQPHASP